LVSEFKGLMFKPLQAHKKSPSMLRLSPLYETRRIHSGRLEGVTRIVCWLWIFDQHLPRILTMSQPIPQPLSQLPQETELQRNIATE
jgi:hypothetical protein